MEIDLDLVYDDLKPGHVYTRQIVLSDYRFWGPRTKELDEWLDQYGLVRKGMIVFFHDESELVLFKMRWQ